MRVTIIILSVVIINLEHASSFCFEDNIEKCLLDRKLKQRAETETVNDGKTIESQTKAVIEEERDEENEDILSPRNSRKGLRCTPSSRYFASGTCNHSFKCQRKSFSYSRTCGLSMVCCSSQRRSYSPPRSSMRRISTTTTTQRSIRRTTQRNSGSFFSKPARSCGGGLGLSTQILNGSLVPDGMFPFMVALVHRSNGEAFCGGVMVTNKHILTAAHCFDKVGWRTVDVRIGQTDIEERETYDTRADIRRVKLHEKYREKGSNGKLTPNYDLAIVTLSRPVTSPLVQPVCLPDRVKDVSEYEDQGVVAGWGHTSSSRYDRTVSQLRYAKLDTYDVETCREKYEYFIGRDKFDITDSMICGGNDKTDACSGDSGGPLLFLSNYRWELYGIVSFGPTRCGNSDLPGVFTRVDKYLNWIKRYTL